VFFKASGSRFGGLAKARFAGRILARESPDFFASVRNGAARKWQTAGELLERGRQQFDIFAGEAILVGEACENFGSPISFIAQSWIG
jgi:hypothetical protein